MHLLYQKLAAAQGKGQSSYVPNGRTLLPSIVLLLN